MAARQFGAIGRCQLVALGHTDDAIWRLLRQGELEDALPGVYRLNGAPRSWLQDLRIATLWAGEGAAVSHRAAAALWGLQGFVEGPITISTPKKNQVSAVRFKVYRIPLGRSATASRRGLPVTTVGRTMLDLCGVESEERVDRAMDDAQRQGLVSLEVLRRLSDSAARRKGLATYRRLLDLRDPEYQPSVTEFQGRIRKQLLEAGLRPVEEYEIRVGGRFVARVDFAFVERKVAVEADGYATHSGRLDWQHDLARRSALTALGWAIIHVTWQDLSSRWEEKLAEIRQVLSLGA